jgi:hypothetical protein
MRFLLSSVTILSNLAEVTLPDVRIELFALDPSHYKVQRVPLRVAVGYERAMQVHAFLHRSANQLLRISRKTLVRKSTCNRQVYAHAVLKPEMPLGVESQLHMEETPLTPKYVIACPVESTDIPAG